MTDQELKEQAEVMLAYANAPADKKPVVQFVPKQFLGRGGRWADVTDNCVIWSLDSDVYRIKPSPIAPGHNPDKLTVDQIQEGHRLMTGEEVLFGEKHPSVNRRAGSGILAYEKYSGQWLGGGYCGSSKGITYCVPIDWKDPLAQANNAASAIAEGHNPHKLTEEQVGVSDGYRLLSEEETRRFIETGEAITGTEWWTVGNWQVSPRGWYAEMCSTLRTKNPPGHYLPKPKKLIRKPCGPEHFPPGTVVRTKGQHHWQLVVWCREDGICGISKSGEACIEGFSHFVNTTERSLDNGKTWLPCYVEVEE